MVILSIACCSKKWFAKSLLGNFKKNKDFNNKFKNQKFDPKKFIRNYNDIKKINK